MSESEMKVLITGLIHGRTKVHSVLGQSLAHYITMILVTARVCARAHTHTHITVICINCTHICVSLKILHTYKMQALAHTCKSNTSKVLGSGDPGHPPPQR